MVDRIEKPDASLYRIQEADATGDEQKQQRDDGGETPDTGKDKFRNKSSLAITSEISKQAGLRGPQIFGRRPGQIIPTPVSDEEEDQGSWTWRLKHEPLVALGILDFDRRPRWGMITTYLLGLSGVLTSFVLILRFLYAV